jgi:hypothetical protein
MNEVKETGGAIIGGVRMTGPFATLIVTKNKLQLNGSIYGTFIFRPGDIVSIEPNGKLLSSGIKINHTVDGYNTNIIFLSGNSGELLDKIRWIGFMENQAALPEKIEDEIADIQKNGAYPLKVSASIIILLIWNGLILGNKFILPGKYDEDIPFTGIELALSFMIVLSLLLLTFRPFRKLLLKPGRSITSFRSFIYFTILICTVMLFAVFVFPRR